MLRDCAEKYLSDWSGDHVYNCAEVTLRACNDCYELGLEEKALKMAAGFGGGMFTGDTCGVITGGIAALSVIYGNAEAPYGNDTLKEKVKKYQEMAKDEFTSLDCSVIKETEAIREHGCAHTVKRACDILESIIGK